MPLGNSRNLKVDQELELEIISHGQYGDGVAKHEGMAVFCKGKDVQKGEKVKVRITSVKSTFAMAEII